MATAPAHPDLRRTRSRPPFAWAPHGSALTERGAQPAHFVRPSHSGPPARSIEGVPFTPYACPRKS